MSQPYNNQIKKQRLGLGAIPQLLPLAVMFGLMWISAWTSFRLNVHTKVFWEYLIFAWVFTAAVYLLALVSIVKYLRAWWLAALFASFYFLLYGINAAFLWYADSMLSPNFFQFEDLWGSGTPAFIAGYFTRWAVFLAIAFVLSSVLATWLIRRYRRTLAQSQLRWLIVLVIVLWGAETLRNRNLFKPSVVVNAALHARIVHLLNTQAFVLRPLAENPLVNLARLVVTDRPQPLQSHPAGDLRAMSGVLKSWRLPLGPRQYAPLGLKPFDHIIVFTTESLSLDFLSPYNTNMPPELTPFYASSAITNRMFVNYQCIALPTQPGLGVTYNSHPNALGLLAEGNFDSSLIKLLNAHGYSTYILLGCPGTFMNDKTVFEAMGFQHFLGERFWARDTGLRPFIIGRGLMDRLLFKNALDLLDQNRNKKIFIDVMNLDTHGAYLREDYGSLQYPSPPASLLRLASDSWAQAILTDIFKHDYDIGQTIKEMRDRNLLTTNTLVILTADHNFPHAKVLNNIPGYPQSPLSRIPLVFLSGQPLPHADLQQIHSQLDFAPTVAHLLGLPIEDGWWGESIFASQHNAPSVSEYRRNIIVTPPDGEPQQTVSLDHPGNAMEKGLVELISSVYTNSPATEAVAHPDSQVTLTRK